MFYVETMKPAIKQPIIGFSAQFIKNNFETKFMKQHTC